ncbi:hypothetical protein Mal48_15040 [Thalassoglobus polymorphus]|uniref:Uncharacterized protein n=1 Tax=Thalassoglobus polymorphus TaxID=2527994 RepID=A0A517QKX8_9PLAN|nr:hypothetical protein Mal48_15040 [Thalassoglobus polymorphus]
MFMFFYKIILDLHYLQTRKTSAQYANSPILCEEQLPGSSFGLNSPPLQIRRNSLVSSLFRSLVRLFQPCSR